MTQPRLVLRAAGLTLGTERRPREASLYWVIPVPGAGNLLFPGGLCCPRGWGFSAVTAQASCLFLLCHCPESRA